MAVDCVPSASRELKKLLKAKSDYHQAERIYREKAGRLKFLQKNLPKSRETKALAAHVADLKKVRDRLKEEWAKAKKQLCPHCEGARWDPLSYGQMAHSCHQCGGEGTLKGSRKREKERKEEMEKFVKEKFPELRRTS